MSETAEKTDPKLWEKGEGRSHRRREGRQEGEWSARKAQLAVAEYKKRGWWLQGRQG
ncbi:hypothetical protein AB5I41_05645 [Sphingomonas sp. MMS24-JH45]